MDTNKARNIRTLEGHLTPADKKAIKAILETGVLVGRVGRKSYSITESNGIYHVSYQVKDRGMIPVQGSALRISTYRAVFKIMYSK